MSSRTGTSNRNSLLRVSHMTSAHVSIYRQTPEGLRIPPVLQPYMQGREFLPYVKELPKNSTSNKLKK